VVKVPPSALSIVVIEDNDDLRDTVCLLLTMLGHTVDAANTGERGVDLILEKRPDVAFVDIGLPGIDGYEVARRLRAQLTQGQVHLIAMTGFGQGSDRQRSQEAGFDAHLAKPADADILQNALAAVGREPAAPAG
jgi:CheY-like chemotaxis protein